MTRWTKVLLAALLPAAMAIAQQEKPPNPPRPIDSGRAANGKVVYQRYCISCHGEHGDGEGYSAQFLDPHPRDFTRAIFKCRSTPSGTLPVDDDLMRTLHEGLYHTNMPSWAVLGDAQLRNVIEYIKTFSPRWKEEGPGDPITFAPEPADDAASRKRGQALWNSQACFNCHGNTGKGDGQSVPTLFDDWGYHIRPFNFTASDHRKCGTTDRDLYRTFLTGMNGTPMPTFADTISAQDAWHLVHFLKTLRVQSTEQHMFEFLTGH
ncbi:MAG TPA: c-type cytochrome [Myxococcales bacterium]|nr:c-type cytochrome [Myxococcales bacterium]